jgi:myosin-1
VCDLIDSKQPPGCFSILDDVCKTVHAAAADKSDATFVDKLNGFQRAHKHFQPRSTGFCIKHYAGEVNYDGAGFVGANKDALLDDVKRVIKGSSHTLVAVLFPEDLPEDPAAAGGGAAESKSSGRGGAGAAGPSKPAVPTAGSTIRSQCNALVAALSDCNPHYVRCIKSNDRKRANDFDEPRVLHQTQYLGLLENVRVRRAGFAYRADFHRFTERFKILSKKTYPGPWTGADKDGAREVLRAAAKSLAALTKEEAQLGVRKVRPLRVRVRVRVGVGVGVGLG